MAGIKRRDLFFILKTFVVWRISLFVIQYFALRLITPQENFLGGGIDRYTKNPYFWSYLNFDGEHYLSIALNGYKDLQYFFFPLYPVITGSISNIFGGGMFVNALTGLIISHLSLLVGLVGLFKLIIITDVGKDSSAIARQIVLLILLFPTSFYFVSFYTESLFLAIAVWSFYFAKKKKWIYAFLLSGLATATRVVGLALVTGVLIQYIVENYIVRLPLRGNLSKVIRLVGYGLLGLSGILMYMLYLNDKTGDPINFFSNVGIYGDQRTAGFVLLPQVFYRYIFKILPNIDHTYLPVVFTTYLELITATIFGLILVLGILGGLGYKKFKQFKMEWGYFTFSLLAYLIPTLSGSFSSLPRYVLVIFPAFLLLARIKLKIFKPLYVSFAVLMVVAFSMFLRGYWVS